MINYKTDDSHQNDFLYCTEELKERPSKVVLVVNFKAKEFKEFISESENINTLVEITPDVNESIVNQKTLAKLGNFFISYTHVDKMMATGFISNVIFYFKVEDMDLVNKFINSLNEIIIQPELVESKINYVSNTANGLVLEPMELLAADYDNIGLYFNDDTLKLTNKLIKKINKTDKGISIIYGKRGCGKTTLLSYISSKLDKNIIFLPISMIDSTINTGAFKTIIDNDSVLIIDDCEILNSELYGKSSLTFANLLQIVDGLYSDEFLLNIILCFNVAEETDIDEEILDCNNLLSIIQVEDLKKSKAAELGKFLKLKNKIETSMPLINILNESFDNDTKNIGYH